MWESKKKAKIKRIKRSFREWIKKLEGDEKPERKTMKKDKDENMRRMVKRDIKKTKKYLEQKKEKRNTTQKDKSWGRKMKIER